MKSRKLCGVQRHEVVWHDATASIDRAMTAKRLALQRVGETDGVGRIKLAVLESLLDIMGIVLTVALLVWLLDASSGRSVVMRNGKTNHRTVLKLYRALHQSLTEGAATDDRGAVVVLHGSRDNLCCRGRILIYEDAELQILQLAASVRLIFHAILRLALGIYNKVVLAEQLVGDVDGSLQISTSVVLEVENETLHAGTLQGVCGCDKLAVRRGTERSDADVAHVRTNHIICVQRVDGYFGAGNGEMEHLLHATAHDTKADLRAALAAQTAHDV